MRQSIHIIMRYLVQVAKIRLVLLTKVTMLLCVQLLCWYRDSMLNRNETHKETIALITLKCPNLPTCFLINLFFIHLYIYFVLPMQVCTSCNAASTLILVHRQLLASSRDITRHLRSSLAVFDQFYLGLPITLCPQGSNSSLAWLS